MMLNDDVIYTTYGEPSVNDATQSPPRIRWDQLPRDCHTLQDVLASVIHRAVCPDMTLADALIGLREERRELACAPDAVQRADEMCDVAFFERIVGYLATGRDSPIGSLAAQSVEKYLLRYYILEAYLKCMGLRFEPRFAAGGTNLEKPEKIEAIVRLARAAHARALDHD